MFLRKLFLLGCLAWPALSMAQNPTTVNFAMDSLIVSEDADTVSIPIVLSDVLGTSYALDVVLDLSTSTADQSDLGIPFSSVIQFDPGVTSQNKLEVILDDTLVESQEYLTYRLEDFVGNPQIIVGADSVFTLVINDNDTSTTSVNAISAVGSFSVFPNPNSGSFHIDWSDFESGPEELALLDVSGRRVWQRSLNSIESISDIQLPYLPDGLYFLQVVSEDRIYQEKLVLQQ